MATSFTFDQQTFNKLANELRQVKRLTAQEMVRELGKTYVRYLMQVTPPFGKNPFRANNWQEQKKIGEASVKRDFGKAFLQMTHATLERIGKAYTKRKAVWAIKYAEQGALSKARTMLKALGVPQSVELIRYPTKDHVSRAVDFSRRPHRIKKHFLVIDRAKTAAALKTGLSHVGTAKAGWLKSVDVLGWKGAPAWVKRQRGRFQGGVLDQLHHDTNPSITMINSTLGAEGDDIDVVNVAKGELLRSGVMKQLEAIGRKRVNRFNAGQRQLS